MAITFPRDLPYDLTVRSPFTLTYQQSQALTGGGSVNAAEVGPPIWRCEFATEINNDREKFEAWVAWLTSLRGALRMFNGRPPLRKYPLAHSKGFSGLTYLGSPFSGVGNLATIGASRDTITVNQIANGVTLKPGDYLSIPGATRQNLHRVVEGGTSTGNAVTIGIEPVIRPGITTTRAVRLASPYCEMVLENGKFSATPNGRGGAVSFVGLQVLI